MRREFSCFKGEQVQPIAKAMWDQSFAGTWIRQVQAEGQSLFVFGHKVRLTRYDCCSTNVYEERIRRRGDA